VGLKGVFSPPGDKSISHRLALMSLLASGEVRLSNFSPCADVRSSLDAVTILGSQVRAAGDQVVIRGAQGRTVQNAKIDCGNSGTTMRLLMGILAGRTGEFILDGDESLRKRPMERVAVPLRSMGAEVLCTSGKCPITIRGGNLKGIDYNLPVASAQLKSAVLLAGIQAEGTTSVKEPILSRDHTERLLTLFGARVLGPDPALRVERAALVLPESLDVPGDASSAAFFLAGAAIIPGSEVTAEGVLLNTTRTGFLGVLNRMGALMEIQRLEGAAEPHGVVKAWYSPSLKACRVEAGEIPSLVDEVPILALVATQATGTTVFDGVGELKVKESDRLAAVASQLGLMGAKIKTEGDSLIVEGPTPLKPVARLDAFDDHRIAMTLRLAGVLADADPNIDGESSITISYPGFHETLRELRT
jgi:3-phosphoshikimate 1-carboxyvinyltransferase